MDILQRERQVSEVKEMNEKSRKITEIMLKIMNIAPVIAAGVFTVLFSFVMKGRLEERILHSATTFLLWMFATMFYIMVITSFKSKTKVLLSSLGMLVFIVLAVICTPLDRYVRLVFSRTYIGAYVIAGIMVIVFFTVCAKWRKRVEG